jgi:hypothetical protein
MTSPKTPPVQMVHKARKLIQNMRKPKPPADDHFEKPVYFIVSPYKTATTTVGNALITLGAGHSEMSYTPNLVRQFRPVLKKLNDAVPSNLSADKYVKKYQAEVRESLLGLTREGLKYDVFSDLPFGHGYIHPFILRALAPKGRFIWVNRDMQDWLASARNWEETHPQTYPRHADWTTKPGKKRRQKREMWHLRRRRFRRLAKVYPNDCLELEINELGNWDTLARFTGTQAPDAPLVALNVSRSEKT